MRARGKIAALLVLGLCAPALAVEEPPAASNVKKDEIVVFFPSFLVREQGAGDWRGEIRGKVHEPEDATVASVTLATLREALAAGGALTAEQEKIFQARTEDFRVDNERGKRIVVGVGGQRFVSGPSLPDGQFVIEVALASAEADRKLPFEARLEPGDTRRFGGKLRLLAGSGLSVISDVDDTVKVTDVLDTSEMMANTFFRPFVAVSGMAERYGTWNGQGVEFHYVTASPWQLFEPLWRFLGEQGFPGVEIRMRQLRVKDWGGADYFLRSSVDYKTETIREILRSCPGRRFVLLGDSGEHDPEVYAAIHREFPDRVVGIMIRAVREADLDRARYRELFEGIDDSRWLLFLSGDDLPGDLPVWVRALSAGSSSE
jgi:phosphatidate phosphatase APP1